MSICLSIDLSIYIYIYIYREREICIYVYIYIYIYVEETFKGQDAPDHCSQRPVTILPAAHLAGIENSALRT